MTRRPRGPAARAGFIPLGTGQRQGVEGSPATLKTSGRASSTGDVSKDLENLLRASKPIQQASGRRKYGNVPKVVDGITFDSTKEAARYAELSLMQTMGEIRSLEVHPRFPLVVHGIDCGVYEGDLSYVTRDGVPVLEDVKSPATRKLATYRLKRKLVFALYGLEIREV